MLTNDGDIVNEILRAENKHEKEYIVSVDKPITPDFLEKMAAGVKILGTKARFLVRLHSYQNMSFILTQGLNRQIRRMCEALGYQVYTLKRTKL